MSPNIQSVYPFSKYGKMQFNWKEGPRILSTYPHKSLLQRTTHQILDSNVYCGMETKGGLDFCWMQFSVYNLFVRENEAKHRITTLSVCCKPSIRFCRPTLRFNFDLLYCSCVRTQFFLCSERSWHFRCDHLNSKLVFYSVHVCTLQQVKSYRVKHEQQRLYFITCRKIQANHDYIKMYLTWVIQL